MFIWFVFRDSTGNPWQSGLYRPVGAQKPAFAAFGSVARLTDGTTINVKAGASRARDDVRPVSRALFGAWSGDRHDVRRLQLAAARRSPSVSRRRRSRRTSRSRSRRRSRRRRARRTRSSRTLERGQRAQRVAHGVRHGFLIRRSPLDPSRRPAVRRWGRRRVRVDGRSRIGLGARVAWSRPGSRSGRAQRQRTRRRGGLSYPGEPQDDDESADGRGDAGGREHDARGGRDRGRAEQQEVDQQRSAGRGRRAS